ncbi:Uncharacterised protein [Acinetobacter baumannii]|nr:hypothetical protein CPT_Maestro_040 [Acinetobacter phage Maestro]QQM18530.1 hypothetical protein CPT_Morttis_037 [Acinetobacter phage Morttis]QQO96239.1 hypothetical protein CPT_Minot_036 [Acinetobacter phage Minot]QQO96488.1 hypothetical protein CPT_Mokit_037 [Acinetobacter phage Mokit]SSU39412.1 Uncharacterised protein [Acinetobacter baumannii]
MVMYALSVAIAFMIFSVAGNVIVHIKYENGFDHFDSVDKKVYWGVLIVASFAWMVAGPIAIVALVIYLLNKFTTRISRGIINLINKRKHK